MNHSRRTNVTKLETLRHSAPASALSKLRPFKRPPIVPTPTPPRAQTTVLIRRAGAATPEPLPPARISDELPSPDSLLWVDIRDPGAPEFAMLNEEFDFSPLSLEDSLKQRQRPKVDEYPNYYFIVIYAPITNAKGETEMIEVDLFVGENLSSRCIQATSLQ